MSALTVFRAPARQPRGWLATLVVTLTMIGVVGGGCLAQDAIADATPVPVTVAAGVVLTPLPDWEFGGRSEDGKTVLLSRGQGSLAITVEEGTDALTALDNLRAEWVNSGTVTATDIDASSDDDFLGYASTVWRFGYSGTFDDIASAVEGEATGLDGTGLAVVFDGWAGFGEYHTVKAQIDDMIRATSIP